MQVCCVVHFVASLYLICNVPQEQFALYSTFVPVFVTAVIGLFCTSYYVFALTQTTVRHLHVAVFHLNIFDLLVTMLSCVFYLMVLFSPYHFYNLLVSTSSLGTTNGSPRAWLTLNLLDIYKIDLSVLLGLTYINCDFSLTLTCAIYFNAHKLRTFLFKYWFLKTLLVLALDLFFVHYYIYLLFLKYDNVVLGHLLFFLAKTLWYMWYLKKQVSNNKQTNNDPLLQSPETFYMYMYVFLPSQICFPQICVPNSFKLKPLDGKKVPDNRKLKQAVGFFGKNII